MLPVVTRHLPSAPVTHDPDPAAPPDHVPEIVAPGTAVCAASSACTVTDARHWFLFTGLGDPSRSPTWTVGASTYVAVYVVGPPATIVWVWAPPSDQAVN